MRALGPLAALLVLTLLAPAAHAAPRDCLALPASSSAAKLTCDHTPAHRCPIALRSGNDTLVQQEIGCPPHLCQPIALGTLVRISCVSSTTTNASHRATIVDVKQDFGFGSFVPTFTARAELTRSDDDRASSSTCRVRYDRINGPGPGSVETGQTCVYPFLLL